MEMTPDYESRSEQQERRFRARARRRWFSGLNAGLASLLMLIFMLLLNLLSMRHHQRLDWSRTDQTKLSGKTTALLRALDETARVIVFIQPGHEVYHQLYDDTLNLLREYMLAANGRLVVERVDPDRNLGRAGELMDRFQLDHANVIIMEYGDRFRVIDADDLATVNYLPVASGGLPAVELFKGEQVVTSALFSLVEADPARVYFLLGHGERDFEDHDPYVGLSIIGQEIRRDYIELAPLRLGERPDIPEDADALIIAAPQRILSGATIERIASYANRSGRLILILDADTDAGFANTLIDWGIESIDNTLIDPARTVSGFDVMVSKYPVHPVTDSLENLATVFYWPRALPLREDNLRDAAADKPQATPLVLSSERSWAELDSDLQPQFDEGIDRKGPLPIAVAVERGALASREMNLSRSRIVVIGDVDFIANNGLSGANADLFLNALNWVLDRDPLIDIAPKPAGPVRLMISREQHEALFWVVVVGVPGIAALAGVLMRWRRRE
ncbi:MAG: GldG family protein [Kiritimatiellia bacterium]